MISEKETNKTILKIWKISCKSEFCAFLLPPAISSGLYNNSILKLLFQSQLKLWYILKKFSYHTWKDLISLDVFLDQVIFIIRKALFFHLHIHEVSSQLKIWKILYLQYKCLLICREGNSGKLTWSTKTYEYRFIVLESSSTWYQNV